MGRDHMVPQATIDHAFRLLAEAARPVQIILFGSYARGDAGESSDLDFLVVEREVHDRRREMVRLRDVLRPLRVPVDILVVSEAAFAKWSQVPGSAIWAAVREGRTVDVRG